MQWLWDISISTPHAAEKLARLLVAAAASIPIDGKFLDVRLPISLIGCCHIDSELFWRLGREMLRRLGKLDLPARESEIILQHKSTRASAPLIAHRLAAWKQLEDASLATNSESDRASMALVPGSRFPGQIEPTAAPTCAMPLDIIVLSRHMDGNEPWKKRFTAADIQRAAEAIGETAEQVRERLRKYEPYGLRVDD